MTYFADHDIHFDDDITCDDGMTYEQWTNLSFADRRDRFTSGLFVGMGIPCDKSTREGGTIRSEKVLKFCKETLRLQLEQDRKNREKAEKENRLARLAKHYQNEYNVENEISPFED